MAGAYRFGRFELRPATRELLVEGQPAALGARAFDVLLALIERRERLVKKDELLDLAWPGVVVEENNLKVQISALRKILGDGIIKTVPGWGYRFAAEPSLSADTEAVFGFAKPDPHSVAVLPFVNLSDDKENEYFSDGISEELLTVLQRLSGLHVAARASAFSFKGTHATAQEIGQKLGVAHLVEGSVRKAGNSVRITARLSSASTGEQIWADAYTRDLKDVFAVQGELAKTIVEHLRAHLSGAVTPSAKAELHAQVQVAMKGGTKNADAYQLYLQGLFFLHQLSPGTIVHEAEDFLLRAVALDPDFALAWAALSRAASERGGYGATTMGDVDECFVLARRAADRALTLEPALPSAHLARMTVQMWYDFDWKGAAQSLRLAQAIAPNDADVLVNAAWLATVFGQKEEAVAFARQAVTRDPVSAEKRGRLAAALLDVGRYKEAEIESRHVIELRPDATWGHAGLGWAYLLQGRFDEALREAALETSDAVRLMVQSEALWAMNKRPEADAALARLIDGYAELAAYLIADVYAIREENDRAFEWLERAYRQRDGALAGVGSDHFLAGLHADPRWPAFLSKLGLADEQLK